MAKLKIFVLVLPFIISCSSSTPESENKPDVEHSYSEIKNKRVSWSKIFVQEENNYLLYFYSETCSHCQELKNEIIEYSFVSILPFYFVKDSPDFIINNNIEDTIGATSISQFFIKGTPSLVEIRNKTVNKNIAGVSKIRDYIS